MSTINVVYSCKDCIVWCPKYCRMVLVDNIPIQYEIEVGSAPLEVIKQTIENHKRV